jgi:predicted DNA-binding antitoxin AbrB/MazE fold protein
MSQVEAVYRHGVFEPLGPVDLKEEQRVQLSFEPVQKMTKEEFLKSIIELQEQILRDRNGELLPDSTPEIAADRLRDV